VHCFITNTFFKDVELLQITWNYSFNVYRFKSIEVLRKYFSEFLKVTYKSIVKTNGTLVNGKLLRSDGTIRVANA